MYLLAHVPAARLVLEQVQDHLGARGQLYPTVLVPGQTEAQAFDLWTGLHVLDHGIRQRHLNCVLCPPGSGHHLRYEFRVTTLTDQIVNPVGSSCIFVRVLGEDFARRVGANLADQVRVHHTRTQALSQHALLSEAGNWREYMRRLGFEWVLTAMAGTTGLSREMRHALTDLQKHQTPLPPSIQRQLQSLSVERHARAVSTPLPNLQPRLAAAPSAFRPDTPTLARPQATQGRRQAGAGNRMSSDDWEAYLQRNRLNVLVGHWEDVEPTLDIDDETRASLRDTIQGRQPFRLDDLTRLQHLARDKIILTRLHTLGTPPPIMSLGRIQPTKPVRRIDEETGLEVLDVRDDPNLREARNWNRGLQVMLPEVVWQRLQGAYIDGRLRADDYAVICRTLEFRVNPQLEPELRTPERFLKLVALLLGQEMKFTRARNLLDPVHQAGMLDHLSGYWHRYTAGKQVNEREVVARALRQKEPAQTKKPGKVAIPEQPDRRASGRTKRLPDAKPTTTSASGRAVAPARPGPNQHSSPDHPSLAIIQAQLPAVRAAWGRGLSHLIPSADRRSVSRAVHQGTVPLNSEQVQMLKAALLVFEARTLVEAPAFTVAATELRSPVRYAAALHRLFGELGVPLLQASLARKGYGWLQTTFPVAYQAYSDTGTLHRGLDAIWIALV